MIVRNENTNGSGQPQKVNKMGPVTAYMLGQAGQSVANVASTAMTNHANKQLWREQMRYNTDMWHLNNWYNSPKHQMELYKEAGLNPNLLYGSDSTSSAMSAPNAPQMQAPQFDFGAGNLATIMQKQQMNDAEIENMKTTNEQLSLQNAMLKKELGIFDEKWEQIKEKHKAEMESFKLEFDKTRKQIDILTENLKTATEEAKQAAIKTYIDEWDKIIKDETAHLEIMLKENEYKLSKQQIKNAKMTYNILCEEYKQSCINTFSSQLGLAVEKAETYNNYGIKINSKGEITYTSNAYNPDYKKSKAHENIDNGLNWGLSYIDRLAMRVNKIFGSVSFSKGGKVIHHDTYNSTDKSTRNTTINN